jgi:DNA-binding NarL/FixJ family response regulator
VIADSNGRGAVDRAIQMRPDVVPMDIGMPELDGLRRRGDHQGQSGDPHLVLTVHETEDYFFCVLVAGAHGFWSRTPPRPSW